jgi:hypothetical protein
MVIALAAYPAFLAMEAVHEAGHVLHAVVSGGRVERVYFSLTDFSRTDLSRNPHPLWVAWGGAVWGCLIPLIGLAVARWVGRGVLVARGFAGFCLISNGAYVGLGPVMTAGDGRDLIRYGAPAWGLVVFGTVAVFGGLWLWHVGGRARNGG